MNKFTLKILQKQEIKTLSLEKTLIYQGFQEIKIKINSYLKETMKKRHVSMSYKMSTFFLIIFFKNMIAKKAVRPSPIINVIHNKELDI